MQSDTRIFVFRLRQLLTFLLVLIILIAAAVFILFVIGSSKKDVQTSPASAYTAGVYTSSITLNNQSVDIQVVVDKAGIFYIDLAHDTHLHLRDLVDGDGGEGGDDLLEVLLHVLKAEAFGALELLRDLPHPVLDHAGAVAIVDLIGPGLVAEEH